MILAPFMLRRVKKDVENELSEKIEIKVICHMSSRQRLFYQAVKNQIMFEDLLQSTTSNSEKSTSLLMNLVMQFRKVESRFCVFFFQSSCNLPDKAVIMYGSPEGTSIFRPIKPPWLSKKTKIFLSILSQKRFLKTILQTNDFLHN